MLNRNPVTQHPWYFDLARDEGPVELSTATNLAFEWITIQDALHVVDENEDPIAGSELRADSLANVATGSVVSLPITDDAIYTLEGLFADGYDFYIRPGEASTFSGPFAMELTSDGAFSPTFVDIGGVDVGLRFVTNQPPAIDDRAFFIDENNATVGVVLASDPDLPDDTLTFTITGEGPDDATFSISSTGELSFVVPPDYESPNDVGGIPGDNIYLVEIRVTDGHDESDTAMMSVSVLPVNDNVPVFTAGAAQTLTVFEESANGTVVGDAVATDADLPGDTLTYTINAGHPLGGFAMDSAGRLTIADASVLDLDFNDGTPQVAVLTVNVNDGAHDVTQQVTVEVSAINDNAPVFTSPDTADVVENTTSVLTVTATDDDRPAQTVIFWLSGGADEAKFSIDTNTGALSFVTAPDYEAPTDVGADNVYNVQVQANDQNGLTSTQDITVTVLNETNVTGFVFADVDNDGVFDVEDAPLANVEITLTEAGVDEVLGTAVDETFTTTTDNDGFYGFQDIAAGKVRINEGGAPADLADGVDTPNGVTDLDTVNDQFTIDFGRTDVAGMNFAEQADGGGLSSGDTATIGCWHNKNGQALIEKLDEDGALTAWLLDNFGNILEQDDFGEHDGSVG